MDDTIKPTKDSAQPGPRRDVLGKNKVVQDRVEQAGDDLSNVNAELERESEDPKIEVALQQTKAIETEVQDVAQELVEVNAALAEEVRERRDLEEQLAESQENEREALQAALHDEATGLPNLALFNDRLRTAIAQAQRHGWRLAVLFIDLDDFKMINDTHGHDVGDRVLSTVAERLRSVVRAGDTVSRRSGDEFLLLMLEAKDDDSIITFAEKILAKLEEPWVNEAAVTLRVRASVGIAIYPDDAESGADLLKLADTAMYAAKRQRSHWMLASRVADSDA